MESYAFIDTYPARIGIRYIRPTCMGICKHAYVHYDVVLHVNPEKLSKIKTELINGQRCILVPINEDEQAKINGNDYTLNNMTTNN